MNEILTGLKHLVIGPMKLIMNNSTYFTDIISACTQADREKRPTALQIEDYFRKFDKIFWNSIRSSGIRYLKNMSKEEKDKVFDIVYKAILKKFPFVN